MSRLLLMAVPLFVVAFATFSARPTVTEAQVGGCAFQLGFKTLHDMIPDTVGDCIENEWHNPYNGDGLQRTTKGLAVWRKIDNWTAFTDGYTTWINGPVGLQARLNTERFPWEPIAAPVPAPLPPDTSGGGSASGGTVGGGTTPPDATPVPSAGQPDLNLHVSDDRVDQNQTFTIELDADDASGVDTIWWWASSTDDNKLRDTHTYNCRGASPCRRSWDVSTSDTGTITIHAKARNSNGVEADEHLQDIRIREVTPTPTPTKTP